MKRCAGEHDMQSADKHHHSAPTCSLARAVESTFHRLGRPCYEVDPLIRLRLKEVLQEKKVSQSRLCPLPEINGNLT
jgi:hypothetical protein